MAGGLTKLLPAGLLLVVGAVEAQLPDPTRPPVEFMPPEVAAQQTEAGLQSIIRRKGAMPAALIDGQIVELGGKLGAERLTRVEEDAVVLRGPEGERILRLMPAAAKQAVKQQKPGAAPAAKNKEAGR